MNIKAYLDSGHEDIPDAKLLICVSSIGPRRLIKPAPKKDNPRPAELELIEVVVFDETASCNLTLWNMASSPRAWIPNQTILLISNPRYRPADKKRGNSPGLGISIASMVEVDPAFPDADWLRQMALSRTKRECVHIPFPEGLWGSESTIETSERPLFTLAGLDDLARVGGQPITGKLSLVILKARIVENHRARKLCCIEWYVYPSIPKLNAQTVQLRCPTVFKPIEIDLQELQHRERPRSQPSDHWSTCRRNGFCRYGKADMERQGLDRTLLRQRDLPPESRPGDSGRPRILLAGAGLTRARTTSGGRGAASILPGYPYRWLVVRGGQTLCFGR